MNIPRPPENNRQIFICMILIMLGFGTLMVHSSSMTSRPTDFEQVYLSKHLLFLAAGLVLGALASAIPPQAWKSLAFPLYLLTLLLLVAVLLPGLGVRVNGAQRWFRLGGMSFQPSELAKISLPLLLAALLDRFPRLNDRWWTSFVLPLIPVGLMSAIVVIEPDLGTALFLVAGGLILLFLLDWPLRNFAVAFGGLLPLIALIGIWKPYQVRRLTGFVAAWTDLNQAPYQLQQSLATMGAGGLFGTGLGKGWQKLSYLPEANTDFVFAVIGEELGLVGTLTIIALWGGIYFCGLRMLLRGTTTRFSQALGFTLLTQFLLQALVNMAVVTALLPPKGIAHPLISRGGSNLMINLIAIGILLSLSRERTAETNADLPLAEPSRKREYRTDPGLSAG